MKINATMYAVCLHCRCSEVSQWDSADQVHLLLLVCFTFCSHVLTQDPSASLFSFEKEER